MNKFDESLRAALGLDETDTLELVGEVALPVSEAGYGLGGAVARDLRVVAEEGLFQSARLVGPEVPPKPTQTFPFDAQYEVQNAGVIRLILKEGAARLLRGKGGVFGEAWLLDYRAGPVALEVVCSMGTFAIQVDDATSIRTLRVIRAGTEFADLDDWRPAPAHIDLTAPPIDRFLEGWTCNDWLRNIAEQLANSAAPLDRLAAAGVIGRLWSPSKDKSGEALANPQDTPNGRLVAWLRTIDGQILDRLERRAELDAIALRDDLERLRELAAEDPDASVAFGRALIEHRDDLASVAFALICTGRGRRLVRLLVTADEDAVASASALPTIEDLAHEPRLRAVFIHEPDSWWASYAKG